MEILILTISFLIILYALWEILFSENKDDEDNNEMYNDHTNLT